MSCRQNSWHYAGINISFPGVIFSISAFVLVFSTLAWKTINIVNLPNTISTVFDMIIADHLTAYFEHLLSSCLSAYLKGCSSQHVILRLTEYCSNRFSRIWFVNECLSADRELRQLVKVMGEWSDWKTVNRGVPPGSIMGSLLFNIFRNDLFYVKMNCKIVNYADDNHLYYTQHCDITIKNTRRWYKPRHQLVHQQL